MLEPTSQCFDSSIDNNMFVNLAVIVPQSLSKQPDWPVPVSTPSAVANLAAEEEVSSTDAICRGWWVCRDQLRDFSRKLRRALLIRVHNEHPFVGCTLDRKIPLAADSTEWVLMDESTEPPREFGGLIGRIIFDYNYLGCPVETGNAGCDIRGLIPCRDDG